MFPCTPLVYSLGVLCSFFIYILLFTNQKKYFSFFYFVLFIYLFVCLFVYRLKDRKYKR